MTIEEQTQVLQEAIAEANAARHHYHNDIRKEENEMKTEDEKKSSGVAKAGLTTGIIGTALGVLAGGGNGRFGGGIGNGVSQELADTKAELARVNAERYTDKSIITERDRHIEWAKQLAANDERLNAQDAKIEKLAEKNKEDIAALRTEQGLQLQLAQKDSEIRTLKLENTLNTKIDAVANTANMGIQNVSNALACLSNTVNQLSSLTKLIIPHDSICPPVMSRYNSWVAPTAGASTGG